MSLASPRPEVLPLCIVELKQLMPGIINQVGPQQYAILKKLQEELQHGHPEDGKREDKKEDEDIPDLVSTNFEEVANKS